jgi:hypothetical protein
MRRWLQIIPKGNQPPVATARCALWLLVAIRDNINQLVRPLGETLAGLTKHTGFDAAPVVRLPAQRASPTASIPGARGTTGRAPNATPPSPSRSGPGLLALWLVFAVLLSVVVLLVNVWII